MKKTVIAIGIVLLVAALAVPVFGHGPGWSRGGGPGGCAGQGYGARQFDDTRGGRGVQGLARPPRALVGSCGSVRLCGG